VPSISGEVARQRFTDPSTLTDYYDKANTDGVVAHSGAKDMASVDLINQAQRPDPGRGQGVFSTRAGSSAEAAKRTSSWSASPADARSLPRDHVSRQTCR